MTLEQDPVLLSVLCHRSIAKWNPRKHEYEAFVSPAGDDASLYESDMEKVIKCAGCGKQLPFGETFTSHMIHNQLGMGYAVCKDCYDDELRQMLEAFAEEGGKANEKNRHQQ